MRNILLLLGILLFIEINFQCVTTKPEFTIDSFEYSSWHKSVLSVYDSLINSNIERINRGLANPQMIRKNIERVYSVVIINNINKLLNDIKGDNWQEIYVIYYVVEGEAYITISTYLAIDNNKSWGFSFAHFLKRYRKVKDFNNNDLSKLESTVHSSNNNFLIISKLDKQLKPVNCNMFIGVSHDKFEIVTDLYFKQ